MAAAANAPLSRAGLVLVAHPPALTNVSLSAVTARKSEMKPATMVTRTVEMAVIVTVRSRKAGPALAALQPARTLV